MSLEDTCLGCDSGVHLSWAWGTRSSPVAATLVAVLIARSDTCHAQQTKERSGVL